MLRVRVRLFASLREAIGEREIMIEAPDGATVGDVRELVGAAYPAAAALLPNVVCAVAEEYVQASHVLRDGDDVALIPPVSGG